jgi:hypothetical protein
MANTTTNPPGWWQASDGNWYPPDQAGGWPPPQASIKKNPLRSFWNWTRTSWKRKILVGVGALLGVLVLAGAVQAVSHPASPASKDVSVSACQTGDDGATPQALLTIHNSSSQTSDYFVNVNFEDTSGTVLAQGMGSETSVAPGQTATTWVSGDQQPLVPYTCHIVNVDRSATS